VICVEWYAKFELSVQIRRILSGISEIIPLQMLHAYTTEGGVVQSIELVRHWRQNSGKPSNQNAGNQSIERANTQ
jgi:hypothetical protein